MSNNSDIDSSSKTALSVYLSDDSVRRAEVMRDKFGFFVELYEHDNLTETRRLDSHSARYAEDCAENFTQYIF